MESAMEDMKKISLKEFELLNTSTPCYPGSTPGQSWNPEKDFRKSLKIKIAKKEDMSLEFDLIGVDPSLANAFRRILISDVPSMAIEKVYIYNNTSIIQDEVLAHRLGLIPLKADHRKFQYKSEDSDDQGTEKDTLEFELKVRCTKNPNAPAESQNPDDLYLDSKIFTKSVKWLPKGDQASWIGCPDPGPVFDDILISKLRPGHEMDIKLYAYKGIGRDHAKFSPVATAYYRLLPEITLKENITGERAERLQSCFSPGVISLVGADKKAVVSDARYDGCSRNIYRHDDLKDSVELSKIRDHFIFTVESTGANEPEDLFVQAVDILEGKCDFFLKELDTALVPDNKRR